MDDQINAAHSDPAAIRSEADRLLAAGLAALKQRDYSTAIAQLEAVLALATHPTQITKAQVGLVTAQERIGNVEAAIALCQPLTTSKSQQIRAWATQRLEKLTQQPTAPSAAASAVSPVAASDVTGFIPLNPTSSTLSSPQSSPPNIDPQTVPALRPEPGLPETPSEQTVLQDGSIELSHAAEPFPSNASVSSSETPPLSESQAASSAAVPSVRLKADSNRAKSTARSIEWRQAGRAQKWGSLGAVDLTTLWAIEAGTLVVLVVLFQLLWRGAIALCNQLVHYLYLPLRWSYTPLSYIPPLGVIALALVLLWLISPWLLDRLLALRHGAKPLTLDQLAETSPEAVRLLKRICNQRRCPLPLLRSLPSEAPLALTYGLLPHRWPLLNMRIVLSQGVLNQLSEDEIATILAAELGHIVRWDASVLSLVTLVIQIPYGVYWQVANWGDRQEISVLKALAIGMASLAYGVFRILRWAGLGLARVRCGYSDRFAVEATGNPNGFIRALLKMTLVTAAEIERQGYTPDLLESFELLVPVGYRTALPLGSSLPYTTPERALEWDQVNPYRHWLGVNQAHPLLGDRLNHLTRYARFWKLTPELPLPSSPDRIDRMRLSWRVLLQISPILGAMVGLAIGGILWLVGAIASRLYWIELAWLADNLTIVWGCTLTGLSMGIILRINALFPDFTPATTRSNPHLPDLMVSPTGIPIDSQPIRLQGRLLGRRGIANWFNQDLFLHSGTGLIRLHYVPKLGPLGNLLPATLRPDPYLKTTVTIKGWFRRGATPWIDVETISPQRGQRLEGGHPIWATFLSVLMAVGGAYVLLGNF